MPELTFEVDGPYYEMFQELNEGGQFKAATEDHLHDIIHQQYSERNSRVQKKQAQMRDGPPEGAIEQAREQTQDDSDESDKNSN